MKYIFITDRKDHNITDPNIEIISSEKGKKLISLYVKDHDEIGLDYETTNLDAYTGHLLLTAINNFHNDFIIVVDNTCLELKEMFGSVLDKKLIVAHNAKYEYKWSSINGLNLTRLYCTMIAEQKMFAGSGFKNNIIDVCKRRNIKQPDGWDKDIRNDFIDADPSTIKFNNNHIKYVAFDVLPLMKLKEKQLKTMKMMDMEFGILRVQMPLIKILGDCELVGFVHNNKKWKEIEAKAISRVDLITGILNRYISKYGVTVENAMPDYKLLLEKNNKRVDRLKANIAKQVIKLDNWAIQNKTHLKSYQVTYDSYVKNLDELYSKEGVKPDLELDLKWTSTKQVLNVFRLLGMPMPRAKSTTTKQMIDSIGKDARADWLSKYENHKHHKFMRVYDALRKKIHNINTFGSSWIDKYTNPVTGKVHTIFRQVGTTTGRFASGDVKRGWFNAQQVPAVKEMRECFGTDPGRSIATIDYSGCEIMAMIGLSKDLDLLAYSKQKDQHSYMGTKCWRAVYAHRALKATNPIEKTKWENLAKNYQMTKQGPERRIFKDSGVFPTIYGVFSKKVASVQGFSQEEGQIFIDVIEAEMPNIVKFVKKNAEFAKVNGYVIHNKRTNSRRWFEKVLEAKKTGRKLEFMEKVNTESEARNSPIQGTNSDLIQEALVTVARWARLYKLDIRLLSQVHDENIYDFPDSYIERGIPQKIEKLMCRVADKYLIPEINMKATTEIGKTWKK